MIKYPYAKHSITETDCKAVQEALTGPKITRGEKTALFEEELARRVDASWAVSFSSGTAALHAAFFAANASSGDRILAPANTFIGTINYPIQQHIPLEFIDIESSSGNIDISLLEPYLSTPLSRGRHIVVPVHYAGIAVNMRALDSMIHSPHTIVIEDAAHALGSLYPSGEKVGSCAYSAMTVFSFHPAKTITTGEGGAVTTNDENLYKRLKLFRDNGICRDAQFGREPGFYEVQALTGNYHITELQAALGLSQLSRLDAFIEKRRSLITRYRTNFMEDPVIRLYSDEYDARTAYHLMVVHIDFEKHGVSRQKMMQELLEAGIGTDVHYIPLYHHPIMASLYKNELPHTELHYKETLSLPLYPDLTLDDIDIISEALKTTLMNKPR